MARDGLDWRGRPGGRGLSRRRFLVGASGLAALSGTAGAILEACGSSSSRANGSAGVPRRGGKVVEALSADVRYLVPAMTGDLSQYVNNMIFDSLHVVQADGSYRPVLLAAPPTLGPDQTTVKLDLRRDATWTDGRPVTADDVVFTFRLMYDPAYARFPSPFRQAYVANVRNVTATDPNTVVVALNGPYPDYLDLMVLAPLPRHVLGSVPAAELASHPFVSAPSVSSGPFKFVSWDRGQQVVLARNPGYYGRKVYLDNYVWRVIPSTAGVASALQTGEIDVSPVDVATYTELRGTASLDFIKFRLAGSINIAFQLDPAKPASRLFGDKTVRHALRYAIDRQKIADVLYVGLASLADSVVPSTSWGYNPGVTPKFPHDPDKAQRLLDGAGWGKGSSGVREKDGVPLQFTCDFAAGNLLFQNVLLAIQQNWRQIGVAMSPRAIAGSQLTEIVTATRDFDTAMSLLVFGADPGQPFQQFSRGAEQVGGYNSMHYENAEMDRLVQEGAGVVDRARRKPIYDRLQDILADDSPTATLITPPGIVARNRRVQGLAVWALAVPCDRAFCWVADGR